MKLRLVLFLTAAALAATVAGSVGASTALACNTSYWNLGCQFYSPHEGHTGTDLCCSADEAVNSTFDTFDTVEAIMTTAGGSWEDKVLLYYDDTWYTVVYHAGSDKVGCYNHHTGTMFVNCRHFDW
jgi:hypothetical protein